MEVDSDSTPPADPLRRQVEALEQRILALEQKAASAAVTSAQDKLARESFRRDRQLRRDKLTTRIFWLGTAIAAAVLLLIGLSIYLRYHLDNARLQVDAARARDAAVAGTARMPSAPGDPPPAAARDIIERYIERQTGAAGGSGATVSVSVSGVLDLVKSLGKAGVISAKTVSDLTAELTRQGADVAAHTVKALVDRYLGPPPVQEPERPACCGACPPVTVNLNGLERCAAAAPPKPPPPRQPAQPRQPPACIPAAQCVPLPAAASK